MKYKNNKKWPLPQIDKPPVESNPVVGKCSVCNIELRKIMHYYCPNQNCPVQIKPTM